MSSVFRVSGSLGPGSVSESFSGASGVPFWCLFDVILDPFGLTLGPFGLPLGTFGVLGYHLGLIWVSLGILLCFFLVFRAWCSFGASLVSFRCLLGAFCDDLLQAFVVVRCFVSALSSFLFPLFGCPSFLSFLCSLSVEFVFVCEKRREEKRREEKRREEKRRDETEIDTDRDRDRD